MVHGHSLPHSSRQAECGCLVASVLLRVSLQAAYMEINLKRTHPTHYYLESCGLASDMFYTDIGPKMKSGTLLLMKISQEVLQYKSCKRSM